MAYDIILQVLLVLATAVIVGEFFEQVGLPSVAGELLSGLILGPTFLGAVSANPQTDAISSIALFFVVFLIGFEMTTGTVKRKILPAALVSVTSFLVPLALETVFAVAFLPFGLQANLIVALGISVPSISIISILVMELGLLERESGRLIIATVTVTDMLAFLVLAAITQSASGTYEVIAYAVVFLTAFIVLDWGLNSNSNMLQRLIDSANRVVKKEDISFAVLIICGLLAAAILQAIGVSYILGAFLAGLIVHDGLIGKRPFRRIADTLARMNRAFFIPLFFGFAGVGVNFGAGYYYLLPLLAGLLLVSVVPSTALTYVVGRRLLKEEEGGPRYLAFVLGGRGAVGIVIVSVALAGGLITNAAYSLVVVGSLVTSLLVPALARRRRT